MSLYRNIHCKIWNDDKFPFVSDDCQLVFFHIVTSPMSSNQFGLYKTSIPALASEKRWNAKRYEKAFREGLSKGFWKYDERHLVLYIPNFLKYNPPNNPNVLKSWGRSYRELPECPLKSEFFQYFEEFIKDFGEGFNKAFDEGFRKPLAKVLAVAVAVDVDVDVDNGSNIDEEKAQKPEKHIYGEYKHVFLTDEQYEKLGIKFGDKRGDWIKKLDEGIQQKGYKYTDHYLTILKWYEKDCKNANVDDRTPEQRLQDRLALAQKQKGGKDEGRKLL